MDTAYSVDINQDKDLTHIIFGGELIINHILKIKEDISKDLEIDHNLSIKVTNPSSIDITFIQLVCSLKKSYESKGYNVDIEATLNEEVYSLVNNSGFKNLFNIE